MPDTKQKPGYSGSSFSSPYKPFQNVNGGSSVNQCLPSNPSSHDWTWPQYDYGTSSRYGVTYLSQGPLLFPVERKYKAKEYADIAQKIIDAQKNAGENIDSVKSIGSFIKNVPDSVSSFSKTIRPYTLQSLITQIPEDVPIYAWVRSVDGATQEVLTNYETLRVLFDHKQFEPSVLTRLIDKLEASIHQCFDTVQKTVKSCLDYIQKKNLSQKTLRLKNLLNSIVSRFPRFTKMVVSAFRVLRRYIGPIGAGLDVSQAGIDRANWLNDPSSEEKKKKYVISVLSVVTGQIIGLALKFGMRHPIGFCIGCIYIAYAIGYSVNGGEGEPTANYLYNQYSEGITRYVMALDSKAVEVYEMAVSGYESVKQFAQDLKEGANKAYNTALDSTTGQVIGDTLLNVFGPL